MGENENGAFDRLVSGLSDDDRKMMLNSINKNVTPGITLVDNEKKDINPNISLKIKFNNESLFKKFIIWFKSLLEKKDINKIYNEYLISKIAKVINKESPGLINHKIAYLDMIFYQRLISLKEAADFFRPYFSYITNNPGDFYVYLSRFVTPELLDLIKKKSDPFNISFEEDPSLEKRNELLKNLDNILNNMSSSTKEKLYDSIAGVNWLRRFSVLPFIHFISQFTNVAGDAFTCPYKNARTDYNVLASLFDNIDSVNNEVLEAVFLYSKRKEIEGNPNVQNKDIESAVKEFLIRANGNLSKIQMFITGVPIYKLGKVINEDFDWRLEPSSGIEAWFPTFRLEWRKIIDNKWNEWTRERKKYKLSSNLQSDFDLKEFPVLIYKPWEKMWNDIPFSCELTGGFLSWFALEKYDKIIQVMNDVMLEGVFHRSENRTEYSEALNLFVQANNEMLELIQRLSPDGEYGALFEEFATSRMRTMQVQKQIESMMLTTEEIIHDSVSKFMRSCRAIDVIYNGIFSDRKDGIHDGLTNIMSIKGHQNREWRDKLHDVHLVIKRSHFYMTELEPIDAATKTK
ncbi:MAG: DUF5312 domain-containing protein [Treponema sp.]|nr:DUF5312 domain-containing protein [Treponema sp.]